MNCSSELADTASTRSCRTRSNRRLGLHRVPARFTMVDVHARVGRHGLGCLMTAKRTRNRRAEFYRTSQDFHGLSILNLCIRAAQGSTWYTSPMTTADAKRIERIGRESAALARKTSKSSCVVRGQGGARVLVQVGFTSEGNEDRVSAPNRRDRLMSVLALRTIAFRGHAVPRHARSRWAPWLGRLPPPQRCT
jgi:hypothetical protein